MKYFFVDGGSFLDIDASTNSPTKKDIHSSLSVEIYTINGLGKRNQDRYDLQPGTITISSTKIHTND